MAITPLHYNSQKPSLVITILVWMYVIVDFAWILVLLLLAWTLIFNQQANLKLLRDLIEFLALKLQ
jgi:hypothetical protein